MGDWKKLVCAAVDAQSYERVALEAHIGIDDRGRFLVEASCQTPQGNGRKRLVGWSDSEEGAIKNAVLWARAVAHESLQAAATGLTRCMSVLDEANKDYVRAANRMTELHKLLDDVLREADS